MKFQILKVYQLHSNVGSGPASCFGVKKCNTDLIARMDSDDYSEETRFEKQIKAFEENPNLIMVGTNILEKIQSLQLLKQFLRKQKK